MTQRSPAVRPDSLKASHILQDSILFRELGGVTVSARYARVGSLYRYVRGHSLGSFYRYAATQWGLRGHSHYLGKQGKFCRSATFRAR